MNEEIGQLFIVDWSFMLILVAVAAITAGLFVRRARTKRRLRQEERRKRRREYHAWLHSSGVQPLDAAQEPERPAH